MQLLDVDLPAQPAYPAPTTPVPILEGIDPVAMAPGEVGGGDGGGGGGGSSAGPVVGAIAGVAVLLALVLAACCLLRRRRERSAGAAGSKAEAAHAPGGIGKPMGPPGATGEMAITNGSDTPSSRPGNGLWLRNVRVRCDDSCLPSSSENTDCPSCVSSRMSSQKRLCIHVCICCHGVT